MENIQLLTLSLLLLIAAASFVARLTAVPYPIVLVLAGSAVGFVPGLPRFELDPGVVLYVLLPPLLFVAAHGASVRDLRQNARVIGLNAIGLVIATTVVVAVVAHDLIDGLPWAAAFALGAIVSPTDPLAATQITSRLGVPRRTVAVIEGESLINDGSALVVYRTAVVVAVGGASFTWWQSALDVVLAIVVGVLVGVVVGRVMSSVVGRGRKDPLLSLVLTIAAAYLAYIPAEELHGSGVIASVAAGLVMGQRSSLTTTPQARLQNYAFWDALTFLVNAVLFASVGLELPLVLDEQDTPLLGVLAVGLGIGVVVVVTRIVWTHVSTGVIRTLDRRPSQRERRATWRVRTIATWCGLRGAVSLAAALALPVDFPQRDLILFITLAVIWVTLIGQGLTLPLVIRWLGVTDDGSGAHEELVARKAAARAALQAIDELEGEEWTRDDTIERMRGMYEFRLRRLRQRAGAGDEDEEDAESRSRDYQRLVREVLGAQRDELIRLRTDGTIAGDVLVTLERELDLEEQRLDS